MAILIEINGDIDEAITWEQKAYEDYNNTLALHYVNMLRFRKQSNQRLGYQLGGLNFIYLKINFTISSITI